MKYVDFKETNRIWFFTKNEHGFNFEEVDLNFMVAGDTDSCYMRLPESITDGKTDEEIIEKCDEIAKQIDDTFPQFCMDIFNCPEERNRTIKTDREAVSDKSLFLTKKRYIMHVIDMEGARVDYNKNMGTEIKKSDTSVAVKTLLTELVDMILDGASMDDTLESIKQQKIIFADRFSLNEIGTPKGCKTLKKAEDTFRATGSMKGIPYQARCAMFYNKVRKDSDPVIYPGDKFRLLYIKHPESKYIGIPIDMETPPEWISDFVIDYDREWKNAYKKITNYLASVGWDLESRKEKQREELFGF